MIIRVTTDNKVSVHPYPTGKFHEKQSFLTGLIGNGCCLVEHVTPKKLYTHWGMPLVKVSILVDEEGLLKPNKTNRLGEYLCDTPIMGNILFIGEEDEDFCGLDDELLQALQDRIEEFFA